MAIVDTPKRNNPNTEETKRRGIPEGLWIRCPGCGNSIYRKELEKNLNVCPKCRYHNYVSARERISQLLDEGTFEAYDEHVLPTDPLRFSDKKPYAERLAAEQARTGLTDAALCGLGMIRARLVAIAVTAALARYHAAGGLYISVLTNPTMGGVAASFASLGDLVFAEPKALIGFAGPRTIKATIKIELPEGFQTSEFLLEHGYIDRIVERFRLKTEIAAAIDYCGKR